MMSMYSLRSNIGRGTGISVDKIFDFKILDKDIWNSFILVKLPKSNSSIWSMYGFSNEYF